MLKWHFKTKQGIKNFTREQADEMRGNIRITPHATSSTRFRVAIFPNGTSVFRSWPKEADTYHVNPFNLTKIWPQKEYPLVEVGEMVLDRNPDNYFAEVEQAAFEPRNIVPGMGYSPDKMLQERLISYPDAHRYRIGVNYDALPVNKPQCPVHTYNRDGAMRFDDNYGSATNYEPNSFNGPAEDPAYREHPQTISGSIDRHNRRVDTDYYTQPGNLFRLMSLIERDRLIGNIVASMKMVPESIQKRQIQHFLKADPAYGAVSSHGSGLET